MLKKVFKPFLLLSLITVMMLSGATISYAMEGHYYFDNPRLVESGTSVILSGDRTPYPDIYALNASNRVFVQFDTKKSSTFSGKLYVYRYNLSGEEVSTLVKSFKNEEYVVMDFGGIYENGYHGSYKMKLVANSDLYVYGYGNVY